VVGFHDGEGSTTLNAAQALQPIVDYMNLNHLCATTTVPQDATGGAVPLPAPPEPTANLVQNPSLENNRGGNSEPLCFQQAGAGIAKNTAAWSITSDAHTGAAAERVDVTAWAGGDRKLVLTQRGSQSNCITTLTQGQSVRTWVWYKGSWNGYGASTDPTKVSIATYYRTGNPSNPTWNYWTSSPLMPPTSTWSLASVQTPPLPAGATAVSFGLAIQGVGTLQTDDYSMAVIG
jgi:hypothetical protein